MTSSPQYDLANVTAAGPIPSGIIRIRFLGASAAAGPAEKRYSQTETIRQARFLIVVLKKTDRIQIAEAS
jgi:hypothetical protein